MQLEEDWLEFYADMGIHPKRKIMTFPVTEDALPPIANVIDHSFC